MTTTNLRKIAPITINATADDFWTVNQIINTLSGLEGADNIINALEDWRDANAINAAYNFAIAGDTDAAETIMGIYDGDLETDADDPCFDPDSDWYPVANAINAARNEAEEEPGEEEPIKAEEILEAAGYENDAWDYALEFLDNTQAGRRCWDVVEEAARIASTPEYKTNLHTAGKVYGMATALEIAAQIEGADADWWLGFIEDFAASNYENGARIEE